MVFQFACMRRVMFTPLVIIASVTVSSCQQNPLAPYKATESIEITASGSSSVQIPRQVGVAFLANSADEKPTQRLYNYDLITKALTELASFAGVDGGLSWSPNGRSLAVSYQHEVTRVKTYFAGNLDMGEFLVLETGTCGHRLGGLTGWAADGHYAIYECYDQYGNTFANVYDTDTWELVVETFDGCPPFGICRRGVAEISPVDSSLLLIDGSRVDLPASPDSEAVSQHRSSNTCGDVGNVPQESMLEDISVTCWSPDRAFLAVGGTNMFRVYDSGFHLLHSLTITGTISRIAWSQAP
jgi:hypothetical protein